jgi:hypothetical protein
MDICFSIWEPGRECPGTIAVFTSMFDESQFTALARLSTAINTVPSFQNGRLVES